MSFVWPQVPLGGLADVHVAGGRHLVAAQTLVLLLNEALQGCWVLWETVVSVGLPADLHVVIRLQVCRWLSGRRHQEAFHGVSGGLFLHLLLLMGHLLHIAAVFLRGGAGRSAELRAPAGPPAWAEPARLQCLPIQLCVAAFGWLCPLGLL